MNDQANSYAGHETPFAGVERVIAKRPNVLVRRAVDAAVDERLAGLGEESPEVDAIDDELYADGPAQVKGVRR